MSRLDTTAEDDPEVARMTELVGRVQPLRPRTEARPVKPLSRLPSEIDAKLGEKFSRASNVGLAIYDR